jgi:hypothetical protein
MSQESITPEQCDGNPKRWSVTFDYPVQNCNDQRNQSANKCYPRDHKSLPSLISNGTMP